MLKLHSATAELSFSSAKEDQNGLFRLSSIVQMPTVGLSSSLSRYSFSSSTITYLTWILQDRRDAT